MVSSILNTGSALVNPSRDHENNRQLLVHFMIHTHSGSRIAQNGGWITPPFRIFPAVHENELSERNKRRGRCNFSQFFPKKIRRRGSKKTSDLNTTVITSTDQDDFENPSHQALQPRPILDALLVSLNFASIKNIFDSVFYSHFKLKFF